MRVISGGLWIWRVENFKLALWPQERYESGEFCEGDSYVVLQKVGKKDGKEILKHDIFFWLGVETTQDEAGTAAYKTVELDECLLPPLITEQKLNLSMGRTKC
ncbi:hypothetical protein BT69DRAFT_1274370 [Atractiella rhizophila]|nr:hypothetical protein BT69DRAFT_1274370 [Atractiella rhizophila]